MQGNAIEGVHFPQGLEELPHLQYFIASEGFYSRLLQRPKRFERDRFRMMMLFQKVYAGPSRLPPPRGVDPDEEDPRTLTVPPRPPVHVPTGPAATPEQMMDRLGDVTVAPADRLGDVAYPPDAG